VYAIISECKHATQVSKEIKVKYSVQLVVMVVVVVVLVVVVVVMQSGGWGWGDGGDGYDTMRQSALCLIFNKLYPNIAENDLQLIIDIKLCIGLLQIEF